MGQRCELHDLTSSYESLAYVLNKFEDTDARLLEALLVCDTNKETPIHYAANAKSNRSINILLKMLAKVNLNNSSNLRGLFDDLLDF